MVQMLGPLVASVTVTKALPQRAADPTTVARAFAAYAPSRVIDDPLDAWQAVMASIGPEDAVVVTGSLFLVGELYARVGSLSAWTGARGRSDPANCRVTVCG